MGFLSFTEKLKKRKNKLVHSDKVEKNNVELKNGIIYREINGRREYSGATDTAKYWIETLDTLQEKIHFVDFLAEIIKDDVRTDYMASIIYCEDIKNIRDEQVPFLLYYWDENNEKHFIYCKDEVKDLNLATDCVIVWPWTFEKIKNSFKTLHYHDFETTNNRQKAFYFKGLDLACVSKGNHSTLVGMGLKKGSILAREIYDIRKLFPHVDTDGVKWINHHTQEIIRSVPDFRFAILYQLARMKFELENID